MTREEILSEIRRTASENGGKPLGRALFTGFAINARVCTGVCTPRTSPTFVTSPDPRNHAVSAWLRRSKWSELDSNHAQQRSEFVPDTLVDVVSPVNPGYGGKRGTFEPRPARERTSVSPLARDKKRAESQVAEPDPATGRGCSASSDPSARDRRQAAARPGDPPSRPGTGRNAAFLEHRQGLPAQKRPPTRQSDRTGRSRPLPASLSEIRGRASGVPRPCKTRIAPARAGRFREPGTP